MNILQINKYHWLKGGADKVYLDTIELLRSHGHTVVPFAMKGKGVQDSEFSRYFVEEVDYNRPGVINKISSALKVLYSWDARQKMDMLLREQPIDVAHFHLFQHQISPSVFAPLRAKGIPIILTLHDLKPLCPVYTMRSHGEICEKCNGNNYYHCLVNRCNKGSFAKSAINMMEMYLHHALGYYRHVDMFIAVSDFYRSKMLAYGYPADKVVLAPNGLNPDKYRHEKGDDGYILYFGRLSEEKGITTLLDAIRQLPDCRLVIAGDGPEKNALEACVTGEMATRVRFAGHLSTEETMRLAARARLTVLPSVWYENCPMSILESFAVGTPVVGSRIGGIPELIDDGVDGLLFEPGNAVDLATALSRMMGGPEVCREMGARGRRKVEDRYSLERCYEQLLPVYVSAVQSCHR